MTSPINLQALSRQFETHTLPAAQWTHEAHLLVGLWHVYHYPFWEAHCLMKAKIMGYNQAVGTPNSATRGYHETLTLFWLAQLKRFLDSADGSLSIDALGAQLLQSDYNSRTLPLEYYSSEVVFSTKARATWVTPDRQELFL